MKKLSFSFLFTLSLLTTIFVACDEDDDNGTEPVPAISGINPTSGMVGDTITISGSNFGTSPSVTIGDQAATIIGTASATSIQAKVPQLDPGAYDVEVTAGGETATASTKFTVTEEGEPLSELAAELQDNDNVIADPGFGGIGREANAALNPVPSAAAVTENLAAYPQGDAFFSAVNYKGAFDPTVAETWMQGWSSLWRLGYLAGSTPEAPYDPATATIETIPNPITANTTLTADKVWLLDGLTYVESGTLTIEPGTVIIAESTPTTGDNTSALIVTTGGAIDAQGTADAPIIFTVDLDNGTLPVNDEADWGGVILLGTAPVGFSTDDEAISGFNYIEGIDPEPRTQYGGSDAADNSGIMRYVSIRYTGQGLAPGDEIQGLTLGGVGSGTTLEYIDIFSSNDDGIEFFGGTVNIKYAIAAFADDDSWDYDLGWSGKGQFWFSIQNDLGNADHAGEWDGADPEGVTPFSNPTLYNLTMIGRGINTTGRDITAPAILLRDNAAGTLANSIIADFNGKGIGIEDDPDGDVDSFNHLVDGEIQILNNVWQVNPTYTELDDSATGIGAITEP